MKFYRIYMKEMCDEKNITTTHEIGYFLNKPEDYHELSRHLFEVLKYYIDYNDCNYIAHEFCNGKFSTGKVYTRYPYLTIEVNMEQEELKTFYKVEKKYCNVDDILI